MKRTQLVLDYSLSKALQLFLLFIGSGTDYIRSDRTKDREFCYYFFGNDNISMTAKEELDRRLHLHYRNFYSMLTYLTLFDEIIVQRIKEDNFRVDINEITVANQLGLREYNRVGTLNKSRHEDNEIIEDAKKIFDNHRASYINNYLQESGIKYFEGLPPDDMVSRYVNNEMFLVNNGMFNINQVNPLDIQEIKLYSYLDATFQGIINVLQNKEAIYASDVMYPTSYNRIGMEEIDCIEDIALMMDISCAVRLFPRPESISSVLKDRENDEIKSFRRTFSEWISAVRLGEIELAIKMTENIKYARKQLRMANCIEEKYNSPPSILIKSIIGNVPYIKYLATATDLFVPVLVKGVRSRNGWVSMSTFN